LPAARAALATTRGLCQPNKGFRREKALLSAKQSPWLRKGGVVSEKTALYAKKRLRQQNKGVGWEKLVLSAKQ
jgi:hypothetical protein